MELAKPEDEHVLDGLLAEVVVDPEDPGLVEDLVDDPVEFQSAREIAAVGLLHDDPVPPWGPHSPNLRMIRGNAEGGVAQ
jgi:hypothetical protein